MAAICGECLSLRVCSVYACNSHRPRMDVLSPAREGGLPEAGRVTAHHWQRLSISCPSAAQVGAGNLSLTQGSLKGLGD